MTIQLATLKELDQVAELLDLYRQFYKQEPDVAGAKEFLRQRMVNKESVVFVAFDGEEAVGFVQLYPSFSSVSMKRSWILNDLYVKKHARTQRYGEKLIKRSIEFAKETGAKGISLETADDNYPAQRLYEKIGFKQETNFFYYFSL
ncbi:N-acetyltransferase family protein [Neobacillus sp. Marseille-QA0830]